MAEAAASTETAVEKTSYSWDEVRAELDLDEDAVSQQRARLEAEVRAHKLAEVRKRQQITQEDLARMLGVSQSRVSQIERQSLDDTVLSTLAAYVEALGGRVRIVADFGDELVVLSRITASVSGVVPAGASQRKHRRLAEDLKAKYEAGTSIRALADETNLSYGLVHSMLSEAGVTLRGRSGHRKKPSPRAAPDRS